MAYMVIDSSCGLMLSSGHKEYKNGCMLGWFLSKEGLQPGDRLVVVPAGEPLPGDSNLLTARIHDLEDTIADLHATIEKLSKDLAAARAEPTVKELCRALKSIVNALKDTMQGLCSTS